MGLTSIDLDDIPVSMYYAVKDKDIIRLELTTDIEAIVNKYKNKGWAVTKAIDTDTKISNNFKEIRSN